jgi:hypothetical protein
MGVERTITQALKLHTESLSMHHHIIGLNNHFVILILVLMIFGISPKAFYFQILLLRKEGSPYFRNLKNKNEDDDHLGF